MRKLMVVVCALAIVGGIVAWPFISVYTVARAIQTADTAVLQRRVDWERLKESLKSSITEDSRSGILVGVGEEPPGFWRRLKAAGKASAVPRVADQIIARYVTPDGLPQLFSYGQVYRDRVAPWLGQVAPKGPLAGTWFEGGRIDRALATARRLESVSIAGVSRLEFVVRNRVDPTRRYLMAFERDVLEWKLVEVRVLPRLSPPGPPAPAKDNDPALTGRG